MDEVGGNGAKSAPDRAPGSSSCKAPVKEGDGHRKPSRVRLSSRPSGLYNFFGLSDYHLLEGAKEVDRVGRFVGRSPLIPDGLDDC